MSLGETQNLLARLYTDSDLRRRFLAEPEKIGRENNLTETETAELARIAPAEINFFAESLFRKRFRAVEKLLPLTRKILGEEFEFCFRSFAEGFQPAVGKKQIADALGFAGFLSRADLKFKWAKDLIKFESAALEFHASHKKILFLSFDYDIRQIINRVFAENPQHNFKLKKTRAVWLRIGKRARHFVW